jgi:hypothetical protein
MTVEIPLSRGLVAIVDDEDAADVLAIGTWTALPHGRTVYARHHQYLGGGRSNARRSSVLMHNVLTGWPYVDHINGDGLDNRRVNLRPADAHRNAGNRRTRIDSTSGLKGVYRDRNRWRAEICVNYRKHYLGMFASPEEAARAYDAAALHHFGEFARLNYQEDQP